MSNIPSDPKRLRLINENPLTKITARDCACACCWGLSREDGVPGDLPGRVLVEVQGGGGGLVPRRLREV